MIFFLSVFNTPSRPDRLVDDECYPYIAGQNMCKIRRLDDLETARCRLPSSGLRKNLYRVGPAYSLNNETDIMIEIFESGPVQGILVAQLTFSRSYSECIYISIVFFHAATMRVYRDFFSYSRGIYRHTAASRSEPAGFHSVRLIGWGEERIGYENVKYWVCI